MNRILGMEVQQQNALFQYFSDTLSAVIQNAKKNGRYDMGILGKQFQFPKMHLLFKTLNMVNLICAFSVQILALGMRR